VVNKSSHQSKPPSIVTHTRYIIIIIIIIIISSSSSSSSSEISTLYMSQPFWWSGRLTRIVTSSLCYEPILIIVTF
jgi:hypothetical protein